MSEKRVDWFANSSLIILEMYFINKLIVFKCIITTLKQDSNLGGQWNKIVWKLIDQAPTGILDMYLDYSIIS